MNSSSPQPTRPGQTGEQPARELDRYELERLADKIIELMKREVILNVEREGKHS